MPNVFEYFSCHEFLSDWFNEEKKNKPFFSYRYMGKKLNLDPGFLVKVLQGKCSLALKTVPRVCEFCGLKPKEIEYFNLLVRYSRAKTVEEIKVYFEKLMSIKGVGAHAIAQHQYDFYKKWHHNAIRCLLSFDAFKSFQDLASKLSPPISTKEAKESVQLLEQLGLVEKTKKGTYEVTKAIITTGEKWKSAAIRNFQMEMIKLAGESLERHPVESRDISTVTITTSKESFEEIRERIKELRQSILQMDMKNENLTDVYQINIQIFPLTNTLRKE